MRTGQKDFIKFFDGHIGAYDSSDFNPDIWHIYFDFSSFEQGDPLDDIQKQSLCIALHHLSIVDTFLLMEKLLLLGVASEPHEHNKVLFSRFRDEFILSDQSRGKQYNFLNYLYCENLFEECKKQCEELLICNAQDFEVLDIYVKVLLNLEEIPKNSNPLSTLIRKLISCYIKQDDTNYASSYIDYCDRYLRAWNKFFGFYELFDIINNTMFPYEKRHKVFYEMKHLVRAFDSCEGICIQENKEEFLEKMTSIFGKLYSCDWGYNFYLKYKEIYGIQTDSVNKKLKEIRDGKSTLCTEKDLSNIERVLYQEELSIRFSKYVQEKNYLNAIHLYMQTYFKNMFFVTRMDILSLNERLDESTCVPMLADIDFFIYAYITDLNQNFPDELSQCVIDSFAEILIAYNVSRPSELIYDGIEKNVQYLKFFDLCCNNILEESPCDLYDDELYAEQIKLLTCLYHASGKLDYWRKLGEVKEKYNYFKLRNTMKYCEKTIAKINADWVALEYDNNIASAYDMLRGETPNKICEKENLFNDFKRMLISCKLEYIRKINKQMGTITSEKQSRKKMQKVVK